MSHLTWYAMGTRGDWEAICVDFDLSVQGESLEDVWSELNDAVQTFLEYVTDLPPDDRQRLLKRKSPLRLRWKLELSYQRFRLLRWIRRQATPVAGVEFAKTLNRDALLIS